MSEGGLTRREFLGVAVGTGAGALLGYVVGSEWGKGAWATVTGKGDGGERKDRYGELMKLTDYQVLARSINEAEGDELMQERAKQLLMGLVKIDLAQKSLMKHAQGTAGLSGEYRLAGLLKETLGSLYTSDEQELFFLTNEPLIEAKLRQPVGKLASELRLEEPKKLEDMAGRLLEIFQGVEEVGHFPWRWGRTVNLPPKSYLLFGINEDVWPALTIQPARQEMAWGERWAQFKEDAQKLREFLLRTPLVGSMTVELKSHERYAYALMSGEEEISHGVAGWMSLVAQANPEDKGVVDRLLAYHEWGHTIDLLLNPQWLVTFLEPWQFLDLWYVQELAMADKTYGRVYPDIAKIFEIENRRGKLPQGNTYADSVFLAGGNSYSDSWFGEMGLLSRQIQVELNWRRNRGFTSLGDFVRKEREGLRLLEKQSRLWAYALKKIDKINRNQWWLDYSWMMFTPLGAERYQNTAKVMFKHLLMVGAAIVEEGVIKGELTQENFSAEEWAAIQTHTRELLGLADTEKFADGVSVAMGQRDTQVIMGPEMDKFDPQANPFRDYLLKLARYMNNNAGMVDVAAAVKVVREKFNAAMKKSG